MLKLATFLFVFLPIARVEASHHGSPIVYAYYCTPERFCYPIWSIARNCSSSQHFYVFPQLQIIPESLKHQHVKLTKRDQVNFDIQLYDNCFLQAVTNKISEIEGKSINSSQVQALPMDEMRLVWANGDPDVDTIQLPTTPKAQSVLRPTARFSIVVQDKNAARMLLYHIVDEADVLLEDTFEIEYKHYNMLKRARLQMRKEENKKCEETGPSHKLLQPKIILTAGGFSSSTEIYAPNDVTQNKMLDDLSAGRYGPVGAFSNGKLYVAGGILEETRRVRGNVHRFNTRDTITTEIYDVKTKQWQMGPNMTTHHTFGSACTLDDRLIVCGGINDSQRGVRERTNGCEFLKSDQEEWQLMKAMPNATSHHSCAVIGNNLYIIGGEVDALQVYNRQSDTWSFGSSMIKSRADAASAVIGNEIIVCGGRRIIGPVVHNDCDKYDKAANEWKQMKARMNKARKGLVLLPIGNKLYAFGGKQKGGISNREQLEDVEIYNPESDTWLYSNTSMIVGRAHFVGAVIME